MFSNIFNSDDGDKIRFHIDVRDEESIPPSMVELGRAIQMIHDETNLRISGWSMDADGGHPASFQMNGEVVNTNP